MSLQERFETMSQVRDKFGVLLDFSRVDGMSKEDLQRNCSEMQKTLTEKGSSDIDGLGNYQPSTTATTDNCLGVAHISP